MFIFWWKIAKIICFVRLCLVTFLYVWVSISEAIAQSKVEHREMGYEVGIQSIQTNFNLKLIKLNQITCLFWSVKNSKDLKTNIKIISTSHEFKHFLQSYCYVHTKLSALLKFLKMMSLNIKKFCAHLGPS